MKDSRGGTCSLASGELLADKEARWGQEDNHNRVKWVHVAKQPPNNGIPTIMNREINIILYHTCVNSVEGCCLGQLLIAKFSYQTAPHVIQPVSDLDFALRCKDKEVIILCINISTAVAPLLFIKDLSLSSPLLCCRNKTIKLYSIRHAI